MASIALCIPTYERQECVREFLYEYAEYYLRCGIDIYYYDSSPDNETFSVVSEFCKITQNVYYIPMPAEMHSNTKVFKIFQQYGLKKQYDFIWICNDAIRFSKKALTEIVERIDVGYDIVEVDPEDVEGLGLKVYEDFNLYLKECAWKLTLYGAAFLNSDTILRNINWQLYEASFLKKEVINFSHVSLYFNRIVEMKKFKALHIPIAGEEFKSSIYKRMSGWHRDSLFILCESWVNTIERLPDCYIEKSEAILKSGQLKNLKDESIFKHLRMDGILNLYEFFKYRKVWKKVCTIPAWKIFLISMIPSKGLKRREERKKTRKLAAFIDFIKRYPNLVLYGAGKMGYVIASYCDMKHIQYDYFCVTCLPQNDEFMGHAVKEFKHVIKDLNTKGIVLCMRGGHAKEVTELLKNQGLADNLFYDEELFELAGYEVGFKTGV